MRALYLLRHSLTAANEARLYCGRTDLPLSPAGRALAQRLRASRPLPPCERYASSGMARSVETLHLLTGHGPDLTIPELREMDFGAFEMRSHAQLEREADYALWIADQSGATPCPGGECVIDFHARVLRGGEALLSLKADTALVVCHGGPIVFLMQAWFPEEPRHFYQWQPGACGGWRVAVEDGRPASFEALQEA